MREAMVICPKRDNSGKPLPHVRRKATEMLVRAFGACSTRDAIGHWQDGNGNVVTEPVSELVAACDDSAQANATLRQVAQWIGDAANQQAVYVRFASGNVEILERQSLKQAA